MIGNWKLFIASAFCAVAFGQAPHSAEQSKCKVIGNAKFVDVYRAGNTTSGTITEGEILDGTTLTVFTSAAFPTPVVTIVSFTAELTITTKRGQLKTSNVYVYDFATGLFTILGRINPSTSTGKFAGATGVLFVGGNTIGSTPPITYSSNITGQICLAGGDKEDHD